jgi:hypothetical protein
MAEMKGYFLSQSWLKYTWLSTDWGSTNHGALSASQRTGAVNASKL